MIDFSSRNALYATKVEGGSLFDYETFTYNGYYKTKIEELSKQGYIIFIVPELMILIDLVSNTVHNYMPTRGKLLDNWDKSGKHLIKDKDRIV